MITSDALWVLSNLGKEIIARRKHLKCSQEFIAKSLGLTQQQISRWEKELFTRCSLNTIVAVLVVLHNQELQQKYRKTSGIVAKNTKNNSVG